MEQILGSLLPGAGVTPLYSGEKLNLQNLILPNMQVQYAYREVGLQFGQNQISASTSLDLISVLTRQIKPEFFFFLNKVFPKQ